MPQQDDRVTAKAALDAAPDSTADAAVSATSNETGSLAADEMQRENDRLRQMLKELAEEKSRADEKIEEERRRADEEKRRADLLDEQLTETEFLRYLSLVEDYLFSSMIAKTDPHKASAPGDTDVSGRFYPRRFLPWTDFDTLHADVFAQLEAVLAGLTVFPPVAEIRGVSNNSSPNISDETDLRPFLRSAVEKPAALIVTQYLKRTNHPELRSFKFANNSYGVDVRGLELDATGADAQRGRPNKRMPSSLNTVGAPDRWGFARHRSGVEVDTHVLVGEYKAAHKLRAKKLQAVLSPSPAENFFTLAARQDDQTSTDNTDDTDDTGDTNNPADPADPADPKSTQPKPKRAVRDGRVFVARVLCQAYHYMIASGLEYGYVASGEGLVFLRVPEDSPDTLYYSWRVFQPPSGGGGPLEASSSASPPSRAPQETATAYLASLVMLGLRSSRRPAAWIIARETELPRWPRRRRKPAKNDMLKLVFQGSGGGRGGGGGSRGDGADGGDAGEGGGDDELGGDGGGERGEGQGGDRSSRKRGRSPEAADTEAEEMEGVDKEDNGSADGAGHCLLPFCTQACLLGLVRQQPLDDACPNVHLHRAARGNRLEETQPKQEDCHPLTADQLLKCLEKQAETDEAVLIQSLERSKLKLVGRWGILVRVTVAGFGYTMVAKGIPETSYGVLDFELDIYDKLRAVQGQLVPVCLGIVELPDGFDAGPGCKPLIELLLLSFAGVDLANPGTMPFHVDVQAEMDRTTRELWRLGLRNEDVRPKNCAWNDEMKRVMHFDFDKAKFVAPPVRAENRAEAHAEASPAAASPASCFPPRSPLQAKRSLNAIVSPIGSPSGRQGSSPPAKRRTIESLLSGLGEQSAGDAE